jgi:hypothetical protein
MGDVLWGRIPDDERHHSEGCQDGLEERSLHFESVLGRVLRSGCRSVAFTYNDPVIFL